jgi:hypothetical protein
MLANTSAAIASYTFLLVAAVRGAVWPYEGSVIARVKH